MIPMKCDFDFIIDYILQYRKHRTKYLTIHFFLKVMVLWKLKMYNVHYNTYNSEPLHFTSYIDIF